MKKTCLWQWSRSIFDLSFQHKEISISRRRSLMLTYIVELILSLFKIILRILQSLSCCDEYKRKYLILFVHLFFRDNEIENYMIAISRLLFNYTCLNSVNASLNSRVSLLCTIELKIIDASLDNSNAISITYESNYLLFSFSHSRD